MELVVKNINILIQKMEKLGFYEGKDYTIEELK